MARANRFYLIGIAPLMVASCVICARMTSEIVLDLETLTGDQLAGYSIMALLSGSVFACVYVIFVDLITGRSR